MKKHKKEKISGITLIALVVTIIVLLILAGISIMMLSGNNGILNRAGEAKKRTDEEQIIEEARMDILSTQATKLTDALTEAELEGILEPKYGTLSTEEERTLDKKLTTQDGKYVIPVLRIYNGSLSIPTIADADEKVYYGQTIDYDVDIGVSLDDKDQYDWKIFYNDGTNIYIIAEDYVKIDNTLMPAINGRTKNNNKPYNLYWPTNIQNGKNGSADIFGTSTPSKTLNFANKFLTDWKPRVTGTNSASKNSNAKVTAILLDTDLWSYDSSTGKGFTNSSKIKKLNSNYIDEFFAVGGPTLEMWVKSWNKKHGAESEDTNKLQLHYASNATGYFVGTSENPDTNSSYNAYKEGTDGYTDTLYYTHTSPVNKCFGYWLASPSAESNDKVMCVWYSLYVYGDSFYNSGTGIRPVVCLPSDITATWNETEGVWNIIKK